MGRRARVPSAPVYDVRGHVPDCRVRAGSRGRPGALGRGASAWWRRGGAVAFHLGNPEGHLDAAWLADFVRHYSADGFPAVAGAIERDIVMSARVTSRRNRRTGPNGVTLPATDATDADRHRDREVSRRCSASKWRRRVRRSGRRRYRHSTEATERGGVARRPENQPGLLAADLNAGRPVVIHIQDSTLPLPLPAYWRGDGFKNGTPIVSAVVQDSATALTYLACSRSTMRRLDFCRRSRISFAGSASRKAAHSPCSAAASESGMAPWTFPAATRPWTSGAVVGHQPRDPEHSWRTSSRGRRPSRVLLRHGGAPGSGAPGFCAWIVPAGRRARRVRPPPV